MAANNALQKVKKGMHVYDSTDNNFGSVLYVSANEYFLWKPDSCV